MSGHASSPVASAQLRPVNISSSSSMDLEKKFAAGVSKTHVPTAWFCLLERVGLRASCCEVCGAFSVLHRSTILTRQTHIQFMLQLILLAVVHPVLALAHRRASRPVDSPVSVPKETQPPWPFLLTDFPDPHGSTLCIVATRALPPRWSVSPASFYLS